MLKTKTAIDAERHQIALENLTRARDEALAEITALKQKIDKEAAHHKEARLIFFSLLFSFAALIFWTTSKLRPFVRN